MAGCVTQQIKNQSRVTNGLLIANVFGKWRTSHIVREQNFHDVETDFHGRIF